jgi:hypothetical protein
MRWRVTTATGSLIVANFSLDGEPDAALRVAWLKTEPSGGRDADDYGFKRKAG